MTTVLDNNKRSTDSVLFSDTIDFNEYIDLENEKKGSRYPFETLDLIISLKEKEGNIK